MSQRLSRPPSLYPDTIEYDVTKAVSRITRWTADYAADDGKGFEEQVLQPEFAEFPLIDDRVETGRHRIGFTGASVIGDEHKSADGIEFLNSIIRYDFDKQQATGQYVLPEHFTFQEPVFVPRGDDAPEGDGYLLALANNWTTMLNDLSSSTPPIWPPVLWPPCISPSPAQWHPRGLGTRAPRPGPLIRQNGDDCLYAVPDPDARARPAGPRSTREDGGHAFSAMHPAPADGYHRLLSTPSRHPAVIPSEPDDGAHGC